MQQSPSSNPFKSAMGGVRRQYLKVFAFSFFLNMMVLVVPLYMLQVYDRVLASQSVDTLLVLTLLAGGLLVAMALVEIARSWLLVQSATWLDEALNGVLFRLTLNQKRGGSETSISQPLRDLDVYRGFLTGPGLPALFDAPWVPFYLALMFFMHPIFGAIATFGAIIILSLALLSDFATKNATRQSANAHMTSNSFLESLARNAEVVHALGMGGNLGRHWQRAHSAGIAWQALSGDRAAIVNAMAKAFRMSLQIAILGAGAWLAILQETTPGVMIAASIIMSRALAPAEAAIANWRNFIAAHHAKGRLAEILETVEDDNDAMSLPPPQGHIEVSKVFIRHPGSEGWLLQDLSFEILPGDAIGVIGPSGIGKSSLIRVLLGLSKPNLGSVRLDGAEVSRRSREEVGRFIGYVPQDVELLVGTAADNISRFSEPDPEMVVAAAKLANAHELVLKLQNGYETVLGDGGGKISGGQRQRIALARALYGSPNLIVLDEPNANLDMEGEMALKRTLARLKELRKTVIVVTHNSSLARSVDKLLVLLPGGEYVFGPRDPVLKKLASNANNSRNAPKEQPAQAESRIAS